MAAKKKTDKHAKETLPYIAREGQKTFGADLDAIWILDKDQTILRCNKMAQEMFGLSREEMIGKHCWEITHATTQPIPECPVLRMKKNLARESMELQIGGRWFAVHVDPIPDDHDAVSGYVHIVRDITGRKQTESALYRSESRFRKIVEQAPIAMAVVGMDEGIEFINRKAIEVFGYLPEEIPTMERWWAQAYPDDAYCKEVVADWTGRVRKALISGNEISGNEYRVTCKNSTIKTIFISGVPVSDKILVIFDDITERKKAEEALKESEDRFSTAFRISPYSYMIANLEDGAIIEVNDAFTAISGFTREEALASSTLKLNFWVDAEDRKRMVTALHINGIVERMETRLRSKNGNILTVLLFARLIRLGRKSCILSIIEDITQRTQAEETLRESENRFRSTFENSNIGVALVGLDGNYLLVNQALSDIFGYTVEELLKIDFFSITHPEDVEFSRKTHGEVLRGKDKCVRFSKRYIHKDGHTIWTEVCSATIYSAAGEPLYFITHVSDITERKRMEAALQESEQHYKMISELTTDYVFKLGVAPDGTVTMDFVSDNYYNITGRTRDDALSVAAWSTIVRPDDLGKLMNQLKVLITKPQSADLECRSYVHGDTLRWINVFSRSEWDEKEKRVTTIVGAVKDITERKLAEVAVAAEKERLDVTLRSIGDAVIATDVKGTIVLMNRVAEDFTGWSLAEATGKPLSVVFNVVDELTRAPLENPVDKVLSSGEIIELANHTLLVARNGTERVVADSGAPIKDNDNNIIGVVLVFRDITEKQRLMETVQRTARLDSLGILAGGIAHDFNNLLAGIYGYLDLAVSVTEDPQITEYFETILGTMNRAKALTHQLLTFAKGGTPVQKITPLQPFLQETAQFALSGSNISCRFDVDEKLWLCNIDKNQIAQVIDNIVINAQQAMPDGGTIEIAAVNISFGKNGHPPLTGGNYVKVSIRDFGVGIPKEIVLRIFDPFYTTKLKGHGLGLATCHSIISQHGGCIDVESEPGKGSTFHVYLPASSATVAAHTTVERRHKGSGTILVMDDESVLRDTFRRMLELLGYTVICTKDGREAVDCYLQEKDKCNVAALIFDLTVPGGMGGLEAAREIRKVNQEIPLFVASGYADNSVMKNPAASGFTASIAKPFTIAIVSEILNEYLKPKP